MTTWKHVEPCGESATALEFGAIAARAARLIRVDGRPSPGQAERTALHEREEQP